MPSALAAVGVATAGTATGDDVGTAGAGAVGVAPPTQQPVRTRVRSSRCMTEHYVAPPSPCCRMAVEEASNGSERLPYLVTVRIASSFVDPPVVGAPDMVLPTYAEQRKTARAAVSSFRSTSRGIQAPPPIA